MILESMAEPTATITLTLTELKTISAACWWAIDGLDIEDERQKHDSLKMCVDTVIADLEEM